MEGDLGFDPLGLSRTEGAAKRRERRTAEVKHGRVAMLAVTAMALQEGITGAPVFGGSA